ncbi:hypothetical protein T484DRAFT_1838156, partial [Baffinella frigidus]
ALYERVEKLAPDDADTLASFAPKQALYERAEKLAPDDADTLASFAVFLKTSRRDKPRQVCP